MWLIVDGYNVLKSSGDTAPLRGDNLQAEREKFIARLVHYQGQRRNKVTVVFDGSRAGMDFPTLRKQGRIEVIYSAQGQTADEVIMQMVEKAPDPRNIIVVSSDREISSFVKSLGASTKNAHSLADKLELQKEKRVLVREEEEMDSASYYERYVKGYLKEEEPLAKPCKGNKYRRPKQRQSPLNLWKNK